MAGSVMSSALTFRPFPFFVRTCLGIEIVSAVRRLVRAGQLEPAEAHAALDLFHRLGVEAYASEPFLARILELRDSLTADDAAYVALAEVLRASLVAGDRPLAPSHGITPRSSSSTTEGCHP
jgi:predicted nucleic acid-binding protein